MSKIKNKMKFKNTGISLFLALGISFTVLSMAMAIMVSIRRSLYQGEVIERSNQMFFTAESGIEAAFFHHNARGAGTHFTENPTPDSQKIILPASNANVEWFIDGRTSGSNADPIVGILKEGERVQINFYADPSSNPSESPTTSKYFPSANDFQLKFYNTVTSAAGDEGEEALFEKYGAIDIRSFEFSSDDDDVLIDWNFSGKNDSDEWKNLTSSDLGNSNKCNGSFLCVGSFDTPGLSLVSNSKGEVYPNGNDSTLISNFANNHDNITLSFQPLQKFEDNGDKIIGIPFALFTGDTTVPKNEYTITTNINIGDFYKTISLTTKESSSIGAFDYVILD
jgi:hypothetical protein